jgi:nitrogen-specific signal transduction histidine kinase
MATATHLGLPGAQTSQKQHAGLLELDAQPSVASIRLP